MPALVPGNVVNVTTAGTPVQLIGSATRCMTIFVQAKHGNTGRIVIGNSAVRADLSAGGFVAILGAPTSATATPPSVTISHTNKPYVFDVSELYIDATVNGDGVIWSVIAP